MHFIVAVWTLLISLAQAVPNSASVVAAPADQPSIEVTRGHVASYPRVITGKVTDADGKPVSGALIEWGPGYPHDAPRESTVSTDDGSYRLEVMKAGGKYKLGISAAGFSPKWSTDLIPGPESAPTKLDFQLLPETTLDITFVNQSGTPIPDLDVTPRTPRSGFNSSFSMVQQPEPIPGHDEPVRCDENGSCHLGQLLPAPEPMKKTPVGDADAQAQYVERVNQEGWLSLLIQQDGRWIHEHQITRQEYFQSGGHVKVTIPNYLNPLSKKDLNGTIYAQVVDAAGKPITKYYVTLRHRGEPFAVEHPEGRWEWGNTRDPDYRYELRFFAEGFAPFLERIVPKDTGKDNPRRIQLVPHKSAQFQFVDEKTEKPVANVPVVTGITKESGSNYVDWNDLQKYADGHHGLETVLHLNSDADGRITVPEGNSPATLIVLAAGYGRQIITPPNRPEPNPDGLIRIQLEPGATIHFTRAPNSRISQQGDNVYFDVQSSDNFHQMFHSHRLDENGECRIESLAPGKYYVGLMHSIGNTSTVCWMKTITLAAGEHVDLPLGEMTGAFTFSGRTGPFTDVSLRPKPDLPNVDANQTGITTIATISDIDGYFEINGLHSGVYDIEQGRLTGGRMGFRSFPGPSLKGPSELFLAVDTHIDYVAGTVEPPESSVEISPEKK